MKILAVLSVLCLIGCAPISRAIVGTDDPAPKQRVLTYHQAQTVEGLKFYDKALEKIDSDKVKNKAVIKVANLVNSELSRKSRAGGESKIAMIGNTAVRIMEQPAIRQSVEQGFEWTAKTITAVAGGATTGTGVVAFIIGALKRRIAREVKKNMIKTEVLKTNPELLAKVDEVARHTDVEGKIT